MRKKVLSALLALCMVIGLLPFAVFAADLTDTQKDALKAQGITEEQLADVLVVDEDTVIEADETRLVVVIGKCKVTIKGVTLATGIVIAPGAEEAEVVLSEAADVNTIFVLEKATVTVEAEAKVGVVTVGAAESAIEVAGEAKSVDVVETAKGTTVTVSGTVETVNVAAPETKTEVSGTVETVNVAETAEGAETNVTAHAKLTAMTIDAPKAETTVAGTVESVTVNAADTTLTVPEGGNIPTVTVGENATGTTINADKADAVGEIGGKTENATGTGVTEANTKPADPAPAPSATPAPAPATEEPAPVENDVPQAASGIVAAPVVGSDIAQPYTSYGVTVVSNGGKNFTATISAKGLQKHTATGGDEVKAYWVGLAIPNGPVENAEGVSQVGTKAPLQSFVITTDGKNITSISKVVNAAASVENIPGEGIAGANANLLYNCVYFKADTLATKAADGKTTKLVVFDPSTEAGAAAIESMDTLKTQISEAQSALADAIDAAASADNDLSAADQLLQAANGQLNLAQQALERAQTALHAKFPVGAAVPSDPGAAPSEVPEPGEDATEEQTAAYEAYVAAKAAYDTAKENFDEYNRLSGAVTTAEGNVSDAQAAVTSKTSAKNEAADAAATAASTLVSAQSGANTASAEANQLINADAEEIVNVVVNVEMIEEPSGAPSDPS